jgi:signal transduction histidine kinase
MEQRRNIYLIFKEALNNAAKYSGSKKIEINSSLYKEQLLLVIKDEGQGFDYSLTKKGNGLKNLSRRAVELGGRLEIESSPGAGTCVSLSLPL